MNMNMNIMDEHKTKICQNKSKPISSVVSIDSKTFQWTGKDLADIGKHAHVHRNHTVNTEHKSTKHRQI